jgi:hypothetical protein
LTLSIRLIINSIVGLALGGAIVFIASATSLVLAFFEESTVTIPGIITVWTTAENDATALNLDPSPLGMGVAALAIAAIYTFVMTRLPLRPSASVG